MSTIGMIQECMTLQLKLFSDFPVKCHKKRHYGTSEKKKHEWYNSNIKHKRISIDVWHIAYNNYNRPYIQKEIDPYYLARKLMIW